jgi:peptidoglycan/LPS O-acetylase OafA/YrhL
MADSSTREPRNDTIEGLRGLSALLVVLYHIHEMASSGGLLGAARSQGRPPAIEKLGPFGVMVFFIISGFLITRSLARHQSIGTFLKNRVIRIYPVFLVLHVILFTVGPFADYSWMGALKGSSSSYLANFLSNLLLLPGVFPLPIAQKNAWSLSFEFAFYLISCALFSSAAMLRDRASFAGLILLVLSSAIAATTLVFHPDASFFVVGVAVYASGRSLRGGVAGVPGLGGLPCFLLMYASYRVSLPLSLVCGFLFFSSAARQEGWFAASLRSRSLLFLGKISYSLYLTHPFALALSRGIAAKLAGRLGESPINVLCFAGLGLTLSCATALVSYNVLEQRGAGVLNRLMSTPPRARVGTLPFPVAARVGRGSPLSTTRTPA